MQVLADGRVRRTDGEWRALLERFEKSGLSMSAFCRRTKLSRSSFMKWRRRLAGRPSASPAFVEWHAERQALRARLEEAEAQLRWFRQQLFGAKSERRLPPPDPSQLSLGEGLAERAEPTEVGTPVREHVRRPRPKKNEDEDPGLRFDDTVPVQRIVVARAESGRSGGPQSARLAAWLTARAGCGSARSVGERLDRSVVLCHALGARGCGGARRAATARRRPERTSGGRAPARTRP